MNLKKIILHNWKLKLISLFLGVSLWFYVINLKEGEGFKIKSLPIHLAKNIPVSIINDKNGEFYVYPETVDILFIKEGKGSIIKPNIFKPYVRLKNRKERQLLPVEIEKNKEMVILKIEPEKVWAIRRGK